MVSLVKTFGEIGVVGGVVKRPHAAANFAATEYIAQAADVTVGVETLAVGLKGESRFRAGGKRQGCNRDQGGETTG